MSFPYSINKKYSFPSEDYPNLTKTFLRKALIASFAEEEFLKEENNKISYKSKNSLINFSYNIDIVFDEQETTNLKIIINLVTLLQITVLLLVLIALLSKFEFKHYLIFSGIFVAVFYFANLVFIQSRINKKIDNALKMLGFNRDMEISNEQKQWLNDETKCPACGTSITENDVVCSSCGLKLKQNRYSKPLDLNKNTNQENIKYHYKEKK